MSKKKSKQENNASIFNGLNEYSSLLSQSFLNPVYTQEPLALSQKHTLISQNWQLLTWTFANSGLVQRFLRQPVDDALRGGLNILSKQLDENELKLLNKKFEEIAVKHIKDTMIWNRLYGGAGIIINSVGDYDKELKIENIPQGSEIEFYDADLWELNYKFSVFNVNQIEENETKDWNGGVWYNYYGIPIHKSRVLRVENRPAPALIRRNLRGWGMSELEFTLPQINMYEKLERVIFELIDEAKLDIYKFQGFNIALASQRENELVEKIREVQYNKNYQNAVVCDKEDDYTNKQLSFSGLADLLAQNRIDLSSVLNIPVNKLFGTSAGGFGSGEDDIESYNCMIESTIRAELRPLILEVLKILSQVEYGFIPDDLDFEFKSLRILGEENQQNVKNSEFQRVMESLERGIMTTEEARKSINESKLLPVAISETDELYEEEIETLSGNVPKTRVKKSTPTNIIFGKSNSLMNELKKWFKK